MAKKTAKKLVAGSAGPGNDYDLVAAFGQMLEQQGLASLGETNALLKSLAHFDLEGHDDPAHDQAQDIAWDAMDAPTRARSIALYKKALKIDPECVDAIAGLARLTARITADLIGELQKAVAAGERFFGKAFFKKNKGDFWMLIETRPYMRARQGLATELMSAGMDVEAIGHMAALIELNPNDNQGVREPLLTAYLKVGDLAGAAGVFKRYKGDGSAVFRWAAVLFSLLSGDREEAERALTRARKGNRFVEVYLSGEKKLPGLPEMYSMGSEEEAILCVDMLKGAWASHTEALKWLLERFVQRAAPPKRTAKRRTNPGA